MTFSLIRWLEGARGRPASRGRIADSSSSLPRIDAPTVLVHAWRVKNLKPTSIGNGLFGTVTVDDE